MYLVTDEQLQMISDRITYTMAPEHTLDPGPWVAEIVRQNATPLEQIEVQDRSLLVLHGEATHEQLVKLRRSIFDVSGKRTLIVSVAPGTTLEQVTREELERLGLQALFKGG